MHALENVEEWYQPLHPENLHDSAVLEPFPPEVDSLACPREPMPDHFFAERLQPPHAENPEDRSVSYLRGLGHAFEAAFTQVVSKQKRPTGFVISYRPHRDGYRKGAQIYIQPSSNRQLQRSRKRGSRPTPAAS